MKLEHLKGVCVFSTHASCFIDFFACAIFSYAYFLKPATMKAETIFVPVHILPSSQELISASWASWSHLWGGCADHRGMTHYFLFIYCSQKCDQAPCELFSFVFFYWLAVSCIKLFVPVNIWRETAMLRKLAPWKNLKQNKTWEKERNPESGSLHAQRFTSCRNKVWKMRFHKEFWDTKWC